MTPPIIPSQLPDGQSATTSPPVKRPRTPPFVEPEVRHHVPSETSATPVPKTKVSGHPPPQTSTASNGHKREPSFGSQNPPLSYPSTSLPHADIPVVDAASICDSPASPSTPLIPPIRLHRSSQQVSDTSGGSLQEDFLGAIIKDFPILDFFKCVWSVTPADIPFGDYTVQLVLQRIFRGVSTGPLRASGRDGEFLKAFDNMLNNLMEQVAQYGGMPKIQTLMDLPEEEWDELGFFGVLEKKRLIRAPIKKMDVRLLGTTNGPPPRKKQKFSREARSLEADEILPLSKIRKLFPRHTVRSYVSGYSVLDDNVTLWYADRMGVIKSTPFNIYTELDLFVLLAVALRDPVPTRLGVSPFVTHFWRAGPLKHLSLPPSHVAPVARCEGLHFGVTTNGEAWNDWSVVGRGTTVVPVIALNREGIEACGLGPLVMKHAWPPESAPEEDNIIRAIRRRIEASRPPGGVLSKIVEIKASYTFRMDDARYGLPRASMDLRHWEYMEERVCRVLIMEQYRPLVSVRDSYEFEKAYTDAVYASDWVFRVAQVLHRDISVNNIMYRRTATGSVEGVLCDWDLALDLKYPNSSTYSADSISVVGTPPFMSIDRLLADSPSTTSQRFDVHRQEHDLESFFYLLVLFVATRSNNHTKLMCKWDSDSLLTIAEAKRDFLWKDKLYEAFFPPDLGDYERFLEDGGLIPTLREKWRGVYKYARGVGMRTCRRVTTGELLKDILNVYSLDGALTTDEYTEVK